MVSENKVHTEEKTQGNDFLKAEFLYTRVCTIDISIAILIYMVCTPYTG